MAQERMEANPTGVEPKLGCITRRSWLDIVLVSLWVVSALAMTVGVGLRLAMVLQCDFYTTLWESGPLVVAERLMQGLPLFGRTTEPPIHVAVYGPFYYRILAAVGGAVGADRWQMIDVGRWISILSLALASAASMWVVRRSGAAWWACLLSLLGLALLTPTGVRYCASTRPDALVSGLGLMGLALGLGRKRIGICLGVLSLAAATLVKQNAITAPMALMLAMIGQTGGRRRAFFVGVSWFVLAFGGLALEDVISGRAMEAHWSMLLAAPRSWQYSWDMLIEPTPAHEIWMMLAWVGIMGLLSLGPMRGFKPPNPPLSVKVMGDAGPIPMSDGQSGELAWRAAWWYFALSLALALAAGVGQGSDQNYLIEPALAAGTLAGVWAGRVGAFIGQFPRRPALERNKRVIRLLLTVMLVNPLILRLNDYLFDPVREARAENALNGYGSDAPRWLAGLAEPTLSLDPWLAYLSNGKVWINDTVAYGWAATARSACVLQDARGAAGSLDVLAERVRHREFRNVVLPFPLENAGNKVHRDIPLVWPAMADAIASEYRQTEVVGRWYRYESLPIEATGPHD